MVDGAEDLVAQLVEGIADFLVGPLEDADAVREGGLGIDRGICEGGAFEEAEEVFVVGDAVEAVVFGGRFVFDGELDVIEAQAEVVGESGECGGDEIGEAFSGNWVHVRRWIGSVTRTISPHFWGTGSLRELGAGSGYDRGSG